MQIKKKSVLILLFSTFQRYVVSQPHLTLTDRGGASSSFKDIFELVVYTVLV